MGGQTSRNRGSHMYSFCNLELIDTAISFYDLFLTHVLLLAPFEYHPGFTALHKFSCKH